VHLSDLNSQHTALPISVFDISHDHLDAMDIIVHTLFSLVCIMNHDVC